MITPSDTPSSPADYAAVTPHGRGPAPYDIQAPSPADAVQAAFDTANADAGAGVLYPRSARQVQTETLMTSAQGYGEQDIDGGSAFGWPANVEP
jgi:hypothetical protein